MENVNRVNKQVSFVNSFGGYNHQRVIGDNEFYDELNMSCVEAPILRTREKRYRSYLCDIPAGSAPTEEPFSARIENDIEYVNGVGLCGEFKYDLSILDRYNYVKIPMNQNDKMRVLFSDGTYVDRTSTSAGDVSVSVVTKHGKKINSVYKLCNHNVLLSQKTYDVFNYFISKPGSGGDPDDPTEGIDPVDPIFPNDPDSDGDGDPNWTPPIKPDPDGPTEDIDPVIPSGPGDNNDPDNPPIDDDGIEMADAFSFQPYEVVPDDYEESYGGVGDELNVTYRYVSFYVEENQNIKTNIDCTIEYEDGTSVNHKAGEYVGYSETKKAYSVKAVMPGGVKPPDLLVDITRAFMTYTTLTITVVDWENNKTAVNLCNNEEIGYVLNNKLHYKNVVVDNMGYASDNKLVSMGSKIVSFPRKRFYDTETNYVSNIECVYNEPATGYRIDGQFDKIFVNGSKEFYENGKITVNHVTSKGFMNDHIVVRPDRAISKGKTFDVNVLLCSDSEIKIKNLDNIDCTNFKDSAGNKTVKIKKVNISNIYSLSSALGYTYNNVAYGAESKQSTILEATITLKASSKIGKNKAIKFNAPTLDIVDTNLGDESKEPYLTISMCDADQKDIPISFEQNKEPAKADVQKLLDNGQSEIYWIDTSQSPSIIKEWSDSYSAWFQKLSAFYIFRLFNMPAIPLAKTDSDWHENVTENNGFKKYDCVEIRCGIEDIDAEGYEIYDVGEDYIMLNIVFPQAIYNQGVEYLNVYRACPDIDFCCERDNRIWGCSRENNEIYACAQGDPTNWNQYRDLTTDSYALKVGSEGPFTACYNYMGYVLFFKENYIHKIYGTKPSNFYLQTMRCEGVEDGAWDTLAMIKDTLYYKSKHGVYAYGGTVPAFISQNFGTERYHGGHAATFKDRYYIFFENTCFVYDSRDGIWHKEDAATISSNMISHFLNLYYVSSENGKYYLYSSEQDGKYSEEPDFDWFFVSGDMQLDSPYHKYVGKILIRCIINENTKMKIEISYDDKAFNVVKEVSGPFGLGTIILPIIPQRCDHMRIRISGNGQAKIYSICKEIEEGGEINGNSRS